MKRLTSDTVILKKSVFFSDEADNEMILNYVDNHIFSLVGFHDLSPYKLTSKRFGNKIVFTTENNFIDITITDITPLF